MEDKRIRQILSAPVCHFVRSTEEEKALFPDKKGWFYSIKLASGQRFVGCVSANGDEESYTFRPLKNLIPGLSELKWEKTKDVTDLGYKTICQVKEGTSDEEKTLYEDILAPKAVPAPFFTKADIKHYSYHPMLERCIWLRKLNQQYEETRKALLKIQKQQNALLISEKENNLIQQKFKERRQNG